MSWDEDDPWALPPNAPEELQQLNPMAVGVTPTCHGEIAEIVMDCPRCTARGGQLCNDAGVVSMLPCIVRVTEARRAGW